MGQLTYQTAGESHGPALIAVVSGMPAGVPVDLELINGELLRRQGGYGRGARQRIEQDTVEVLSGVRQGRTIGSPVALRVANKDSRIDDEVRTPPVHRPRPGHADLAGSIKYLTTDCRETLERASARETAARVCAGALARCLLREIGIETFGFVRAIRGEGTGVEVREGDRAGLAALRDQSETYCPDVEATARQCEAIRQAKIDRDTLGGLVETHVFGCPPGLGTCMTWEEKLDARLAYAVMSVQAIKCVEIGLGKACAAARGSEFHDAIRYRAEAAGGASLGYARDSNNAGGTEGGMSNGMPVVVRAAMKPISTLLRGMPSVDLRTGAAEQSQYERSDICAVSAASVVVENVVAFEIARAAAAKFGGDSLGEFRRNHAGFLEAARALAKS